MQGTKMIFWFLENACKTISAIRLEDPIVLVGLTALSVDIKTKVLTFSCVSLWVPSKTLPNVPSPKALPRT